MSKLFMDRQIRIWRGQYLTGPAVADIVQNERERAKAKRLDKKTAPSLTNHSLLVKRSYKLAAPGRRCGMMSSAQSLSLCGTAFNTFQKTYFKDLMNTNEKLPAPEPNAAWSATLAVVMP